MNRIKAFGLTALGMVGLAGILLAATNKKDKPQFRKIEVTHCVDGEITTYDTVVAMDSDFGAQEYLDELGIEEKRHLSIIKLSGDVHEMDFHSYDDVDGGDNMMFQKHIIINHHDMENGENIDIDIDLDISDEMQKLHKELENLHHGIDHSKMIIIQDMDDMWEGMDSLHGSIEEMLKSLNINCDSLNDFHFEFDSTMSFEDGNAMFFKDFDIDFDFDSTMGEFSFEFPEMMKIDIDIDGLDELKNMDINEFHEHPHGDFHFESLHHPENYTVVIVTEGLDDPKKSSEMDKEEKRNAMKIFPNPASEAATLQMDFKKKRPTTVRITDVKGNVMKSFELGEFSGKYEQRIDVSDWAKGIYLIKMTHGDYSKVEKLIVE